MQEDVIDRGIEVPSVDTQSRRSVPLWVQVHYQNAVPHLGQSCAKVDGGSRLADPTFLVGYRQYAGKWWLAWRCSANAARRSPLC